MAVLLESRKVCKFFGGLKAVNEVDMKVEQGEIFGIIGPNGAGKTTFFNLCAGTYPVTSGEIWFKGRNITNTPPAKIARLGIARTFQNIQLFRNMSVLTNVSTGFHIHTRTNLWSAILHTRAYREDEKMIYEKSLELLEKLGLMDYRDALAKNLPYGIQRKVEIARALATNPTLLLLDEPAAGMNPNETRQLLEFIQKLNAEGFTVIIIEHDMKFVMNLCHRMIVLHYGKKICEGSAGTVKTSPEVEQAYFGKGLTINQDRLAEEGIPNA
jgi:branched-chain amino acid transport system ATP-binding protein